MVANVSYLLGDNIDLDDSFVVIIGYCWWHDERFFKVKEWSDGWWMVSSLMVYWW